MSIEGAVLGDAGMPSFLKMSRVRRVSRPAPRVGRSNLLKAVLHTCSARIEVPCVAYYLLIRAGGIGILVKSSRLSIRVREPRVGVFIKFSNHVHLNLSQPMNAA